MIKGLKKNAILFCIFAGLILGSCDDNLTKVGTTIQPPEDLITVYTDTFMVKASTVKLDSVFAKTSDFLLGEMYDPVYGNIKSDILCQFYCEEGFRFARTPRNGKVDSVELIIEFQFKPDTRSLYAYGDTMSPMQLTVYPIDRPLRRNFYTNDDPKNYCDMNNPLGVKSYTAFDMSIPDDIRFFKDVNGNYTYAPSISVKLPVELGQKFYDETINNPSTFESQSAFNEFFPGVYITNTFGSGCVLKTSSSSVFLRICYDSVAISSDGGDSILVVNQYFRVSKEVVQINRFENNNLDMLLEENSNHTYIKAPAGVCTKLVIPTTDISNKLDINDRYINNFNFALRYLPEDERNFAYTPPSHLLLIPEDSVKSFFETGMTENGVTSFMSFSYYIDLANSANSTTSSYATPYGYNPSTRTYTFGNISSLVKTHIENSPDEDLRLLALPVTRTATSQSGVHYTTAVSNRFDLSGVKIRTEDEYMKFVVLSSKYEGKK